MKKGDEDKISQALAKMMSEDKTLRVVNYSANRQSLIYGLSHGTEPSVCSVQHLLCSVLLIYS